MIKMIIHLLDKTKFTSKELDIARGINKFPENWSELKRYIKFRIQNK